MKMTKISQFLSIMMLIAYDVVGQDLKYYVVLNAGEIS